MYKVLALTMLPASSHASAALFCEGHQKSNGSLVWVVENTPNTKRTGVYRARNANRTLIVTPNTKRTGVYSARNANRTLIVTCSFALRLS